jgi:hypothetical protein
MSLITSINLTYIKPVDRLGLMDRETRSTDVDSEPSKHECECPEPCNCDHEND